MYLKKIARYSTALVVGIALGGTVSFIIRASILPVGAQANSPMAAAVYAGMGNPTSNNVPCGVGAASTNTASIYIQRDATGNGIWKCVLGSDGATFTWLAPANASAATSSTLGLVQLPSGQTSTVLSTVAITGSYSDLLNLPSIPTTTSQLTNNSGFLTAPVANASLANPSTTVNGQTCTLGGNCTIAVGTGTVSAVTGTTPIVSSGGTSPAISCPTCLTTSNRILGTTAAFGGALLAIGGYASGTASVPGATVGSACFASPADGVKISGTSIDCAVSTSGVATVYLNAIVSLTPTSKTYKVIVEQ
jgi:hypothetical protein